MFINQQTKRDFLQFVTRVCRLGYDFKNQTKTLALPSSSVTEIIVPTLPVEGTELPALVDEFEQLLDKSVNFSSVNFMGFPDCGTSSAAILAAILLEFAQQNQINQSFCSKTLTQIELITICWMRKLLGYTVKDNITSALEAGGICTNGGTASNTTALLIARNKFYHECASTGLFGKSKAYVIIPEHIGHYSVKESCSWIGLGDNFLEVPTCDFRYDLKQLNSTLHKYKGKIMAVVAYAGDSRTQTIEHLQDVYNIVKSVDESIWLHCDACHGFVLAFSKLLKSKIKGIELFDSITIDPHKALYLPYTLSMLLVRDYNDLTFVQSKSELIMSQNYDLGQFTPFIGSKRADSLKLYATVKNLGVSKISELIEKRVSLATFLYEKLNKHRHFLTLNVPDYNAVMFLHTGFDQSASVEEIIALNKEIYQALNQRGDYYLHQFPIIVQEGQFANRVVYPLRYMSGNNNLDRQKINQMLEYIDTIAKEVSNNAN